MKDVQNVKGNYKYNIKKVGIQDFKHIINIRRKDGSIQPSIADIAISVNLDKSLRGINMSRLPLSVYNINFEECNEEYFKGKLKEISQVMESEEIGLTIKFDYFLKKEAPVSKAVGYLNYTCTFDLQLSKGANGEDIYDMFLAVEVPMTSLCPCSKEISNYSAHNQRGFVTTFVKYVDSIAVEDLISIAEESSSCEIYPVLKRVDEKYVTEKAYDNPRFVEDMVRVIAEKLMEDDRITWFKVRSVHQESIHNHNAFAEIEYDKTNYKVC